MPTSNTSRSVMTTDPHNKWHEKARSEWVGKVISIDRLRGISLGSGALHFTVLELGSTCVQASPEKSLSFNLNCLPHANAKPEDPVHFLLREIFGCEQSEIDILMLAVQTRLMPYLFANLELEVVSVQFGGEEFAVWIGDSLQIPWAPPPLKSGLSDDHLRVLYAQSYFAASPGKFGNYGKVEFHGPCIREGSITKSSPIITSRDGGTPHCWGEPDSRITLTAAEMIRTLHIPLDEQSLANTIMIEVLSLAPNGSWELPVPLLLERLFRDRDIQRDAQRISDRFFSEFPTLSVGSFVNVNPKDWFIVPQGLPKGEVGQDPLTAVSY